MGTICSQRAKRSLVELTLLGLCKVAQAQNLLQRLQIVEMKDVMCLTFTSSSGACPARYTVHKWGGAIVWRWIHEAFERGVEQTSPPDSCLGWLSEGIQSIRLDFMMLEA